MANCDIQELDKTVKYLKKNLEQIKLTNTNYIRNNNNINKRNFCYQCGCEVNNNNNYQEYDINKLLEDNKALYRNNKELKNKLEKVMQNLNSTNSNNEAN